MTFKRSYESDGYVRPNGNKRPEWRSEAHRRGADKQPGLALVQDEDRLGYGRERAKLNQHNDGYGGHGRCHGMHHDAQRAMVGVSIFRVQVSDLGDRKQGQQDKAQSGDRQH